MQWSEVIDSPYLKDLPFKIELNRYGKIEMMPVSNKHGRLKAYIGFLLEDELTHGQSLINCSIQTTEGVRVADVAWCSKEFIEQHAYETPYSKAPEICVEVVSPSNSKIEMTNKAQWYLQAGAKEVWVVWESGSIDYYDQNGQQTQSSFVQNVKLPAN